MDYILFRLPVDATFVLAIAAALYFSDKATRHITAGIILGAFIGSYVLKVFQDITIDMFGIVQPEESLRVPLARATGFLLGGMTATSLLVRLESQRRLVGNFCLCSAFICGTAAAISVAGKGPYTSIWLLVQIGPTLLWSANLLFYGMWLIHQDRLLMEQRDAERERRNQAISHRDAHFPS